MAASQVVLCHCGVLPRSPSCDTEYGLSSHPATNLANLGKLGRPPCGSRLSQ